jgi:uncharacterized protein YbcC (UPF0753/DUF2309 family)
MIAVKETEAMRNEATALDTPPLALAAERAARRIPPLWPLDSHVAVNPYLGESALRLAEAGAVLSRSGGGPITMPRSWYLERIADGRIAESDLEAALDASPYAEKPKSLEALLHAAGEPRPEPAALPTVADLAAKVSGTDWPGLAADRIGVWAASHFDAGQALWVALRGKTAWAAYRSFASHDITPEIMGLAGFAAFVADAPESAPEAISRAAHRLGLDETALESYAHQLFLSLGGWAQLARYRLWRAELAGESDGILLDLLAVRLLWEEVLYERYETALQDDWEKVRATHAQPASPSAAAILDEILQEAWERSGQRHLSERLCETSELSPEDTRPALQAAFCIDVRSEVFRRALESLDGGIRTLGFAGFFGVAAEHRRFASDVAERRLPVLLNPGVHSSATADADRQADLAARFKARARRAWGRFKLAAVSSFAFVEAMGPVYGIKLLRDTFKLNPESGKTDPAPQFEPPLDLSARVKSAETVLRAMSLTSGFAPIVLLAGHGARVVNNPHASGLQCGACGGYSGEVNARLLAGLLNDPEVRAGLAGRGIVVPEDTLFIAALHDTTSDAMTLYTQDVPASGREEELRQVRSWLKTAGGLARSERALRLPRAESEGDLPSRARDWAEVRPEWGLAGCRAFIAAPRRRTAGKALSGQTFLHDYDWKQDSANGFAVLELIMTAPVVVASWINLQYYGSTVAPEVFGAGNKLLHNVVGGIGVLEGNSGPMRTGLPWQSVHDGEKYIHEPLRLSVCVEAPREAMSAVLGRHEEVRKLFDNRWLHLFALDEDGRMAWRYAGDLSWEACPDAAQPARKLNQAS